MGVALLLNLTAWVWAAWYIRPQEGNIFLHYTILYGIDYVGAWWGIFRLPFLGLIIFFTNSIVGWLIFHRDKTAGHLLQVINVVAQAFLLIAVILLVFLNV